MDEDREVPSFSTASRTVTALDTGGAESPPSAPATGTAAGGAETCFTASRYAHVAAGRAYANGMGFAYAEGSGQALGFLYYGTATLKQTGPDYYVIGISVTARSSKALNPLDRAGFPPFSSLGRWPIGRSANMRDQFGGTAG